MAVLQRVRHVIWAFRMACAIVLILGAAETITTGEEHWVERSGKMIVALALTLTYFQFRYEVRHGAEEKTARQEAAQLLQRKSFVTAGAEVEILERIETTVRTRYESDRTYIILNAVAAGAIGELVSAFGGLVLKHFS